MSNPPVTERIAAVPVSPPRSEQMNVDSEPAPAHVRERTISGIDLIDQAAGGLLPGQPYVVRGPIGLGKSIVGLQFIARGLELGEPAILVTRQNPEQVMQQARSLGFGLEESVRRGQLVVLRPSGNYFDLVESPADVNAIAEELSDYVRESGAQRLVVDPIYALITTSFSSHFAVTIAQSLLNALEELPVTTLLIGGDDDNPELAPIVRVIEQNSAGVIELSEDPTTRGRLMRVRRLRHASDQNLVSHYRILDGRGITNYRGEGELVTDVTKPWEDASIRRSVLVLGSSPDTIRRITESLGDDWTVSAETDYRAGLERARNDKPGLVVVTPGRSMEAVSTVVELGRESESSVVFLSPHSNRTADKSFYLRSGADDFISEPFTADEFRARAEALVRRSGRRRIGGTTMQQIPTQELLDLPREEGTSFREVKEVMHRTRSGVKFDPSFHDKIKRNVDTVSSLDMNFALYWIKAKKGDGHLNRELSRLCRQEDILCRNRNGEFVALLTGADESGVRGFESRLEEKLGEELNAESVSRGYTLYTPGEPIDGFTGRALQS